MEIDPKPLQNKTLARPANEPDTPPIYVVSGSVGALGEQLVQTILPQFPKANVPLKMIRKVHHISQIEAVLNQALQSNGTVIHTLTNAEMRQAMARLLKRKRW